MKKRGPAILLVVLIVILVFIVGVRYGQNVEKTNKQVSALLSVPPTKAQPTQAALAFETYDGTACGVQLLYPAYLEVKNESTQAATISAQDQLISFSCGSANPFSTLLKDQKVASDEIELEGRMVPIQFANAEVYFSLSNTITGRQVYFAVTKSLIPLFRASLEFVALPRPTVVPTSAR